MSWLDSMANQRGTPVGEMEDVLDEAAEEIVNWAEGMDLALMPDGRPFGMEKQTKQEEAQFYAMNIRGRPEAWMTWKDRRAAALHTALSGVGMQLASEIDVDMFVHGYAMAYSAEMERLLAPKTVYSEEAYFEDAASIPVNEEMGMETWFDPQTTI